jgi:hypothetical protein
MRACVCKSALLEVRTIRTHRIAYSWGRPGPTPLQHTIHQTVTNTSTRAKTARSALTCHHHIECTNGVWREPHLHAEVARRQGKSPVLLAWNPVGRREVGRVWDVHLAHSASIRDCMPGWSAPHLQHVPRGHEAARLLVHGRRTVTDVHLGPRDSSRSGGHRRPRSRARAGSCITSTTPIVPHHSNKYRNAAVMAYRHDSTNFP